MRLNGVSVPVQYDSITSRYLPLGNRTKDSMVEEELKNEQY